MTKELTKEMTAIKAVLEGAGWMQDYGAYVLVDGQYGSTGKGLAAGVLAELFHDKVGIVTTNAGPNSGHTSYFGDEKIVLCQLPTFGVIARKMGSAPTIMMNAGAIIDIDRLQMERKYLNSPFDVFVHPTAAVVRPEDKEAESELVASVGSTGKGTGAALAAKILRDPKAVYSAYEHEALPPMGGIPLGGAEDACIFVEVSQGFSLSLNAGGMYPYCTSRDCTVGQALSDANIHPNHLRQTMIVVRTFPIRVAGNSGPCFPDQEELTWEQLGQEAEITTVTKKVRRVFTFSVMQFKAAVAANRPEHVFVNFMNYIEEGPKRIQFLKTIREAYFEVMGDYPLSILVGYGPKSEDVVLA